MPELTAEFVEREYDNRSRVPDHARYFERWATESERVRRELDCRLDLAYGPRPRERLDIFPAAQARGTLVFIHGGYWRAFDKREHSWVAPPFVAAGLSVAVLNYDLCPDVTVARIVDQQRLAIGWLAANGYAHGAPEQRMVIAGHSAGGHLAAMLFATEWHRWNVAPRLIAGGVAVSGLFDLVPLTRFSYNTDLKLDEAEARRLSPADMQPVVHAPLLLAVGALESSEYVRQSQLLWDRWPSVRPSYTSQPMRVSGRHHFSVIEALAEPGHSLFEAVVRLFD
jgi:arylformamidase